MENDIFTQINYENYKNEIFVYCDLEEGSERKVFSSEIIKEILTKLDLDLEKPIEQLTKKREAGRFYQRQVLRLFIKLTLIAPAKKSVICNLQFLDFGEDFRTVRINKTNVRIPNSLRGNLLTAMDIARKTRKIEPKKNDKLLNYVFNGKFANTSLNPWFCTFLKEYSILDIDKSKESYELEPIMKSAISGIKIATLESTYYDNIEELSYIKTIDDDINWGIAKNDYYHYI